MVYMTLKEANGKNGAFRPVRSMITASMDAFPGAVKIAGAWLIPKEAEKPEDRRYTESR